MHTEPEHACQGPDVERISITCMTATVLASSFRTRPKQLMKTAIQRGSSTYRSRVRWSYAGADFAVDGGTLSGEYYIVRDVPVDAMEVTEGSLFIAEREDLPSLRKEFSPSGMALSSDVRNCPSSRDEGAIPHVVRGAVFRGARQACFDKLFNGQHP